MGNSRLCMESPTEPLYGPNIENKTELAYQKLRLLGWASVRQMLGLSSKWPEDKECQARDSDRLIDVLSSFEAHKKAIICTYRLENKNTYTCCHDQSVELSSMEAHLVLAKSLLTEYRLKNVPTPPKASSSVEARANTKPWRVKVAKGSFQPWETLVCAWKAQPNH